ncbi:DUF4352 domain-containing protein [Nocardiopsis halophila]|uniref:DUF4352 domain-containing protein n=1 Tax=Nocardiopsis halophila TaxID=141692 RepID=UPI000344CBDE|nr:DUF4352 domain-containing protein [Nocardiopsis halophila]
MAFPPPPPPPPPSAPKGMSTGAKIGLGCGGCAAAAFMGFMGLMVLGLLAGGAGDGPTASEPAGDGAAQSAGGGGEDAGDGADDAGGDEDAEETYAVGDTVPHGDWDITVTSVEEGATEIEDEFGLVEEAGGQFVVMEIEAANTSSEGQYFEAGNQVLMDPDGSMYEYDIPASSGIDWLEKVNPGSEISGAIAYDVPEDFELDHILVNGKSTFADGVRVDVD